MPIVSTGIIYHRMFDEYVAIMPKQQECIMSKKFEKSVFRGIVLTNQLVATIGIGQMMKHLTRDANLLSKIGASYVAYLIGKYIAERSEEMLNQIDEM